MVEITDHKEGDYFVPDLYLEKEDYENDYIIGKFFISFSSFANSKYSSFMWYTYPVSKNINLSFLKLKPSIT